MKTAEEWEFEIYECDTIQERISVAKAIQLDAYRAGMAEAIRIADEMATTSLTHPNAVQVAYLEGCGMVSRKIHSARDAKTTI